MDTKTVHRESQYAQSSTCQRLKPRKLDRTVKYARVATFHAVSSVQLLFLLSLVLEAIEKCEQALVLRHDRCQKDHQVN